MTLPSTSIDGGKSDDELRREYLTAWVGGSSKQKSLALKQAANEVFGLEGTVYARYARRAPRPSQVAEARRAILHMYREPQAALHERDITGVRLYRCIQDLYVEAGVVEAWTSDPWIAEQFAGAEGYLVEETIPATRILA